MKFKWCFVRQGSLITSLKDNELAVDVGSKDISPWRIFDHHSDTKPKCTSSAEVLLSRLNELDSLKNKKEVIIYSHANPDTDCAVSSFIAFLYLAENKTFSKKKKEIQQLVDIICKIDQGKISPVSFEMEESGFNFYTFFLLVDDYIRSQKTKDTWDIVESFISRWNLQLSNDSPDEQFMAYSFVFLKQLFENDQLINALTLINDTKVEFLKSLDEFLESGNVNEQLKIVFTDISKFISNTLERGRKQVLDMFARGEHEAFPVNVPIKNKTGEHRDAQVLYAKLPFITIPFLKALRGVSIDFAQIRKIDILAFQPWEENNRVIISVDPKSDISLKGLGLALDRKNNEKSGKQRIKYSRYWNIVNGENKPDPLFPYQDPWFDGRGFDYTIVDSPSSPSNRNITPGEIKNVLKSDWHKLAQEYESDEYKKWLSGKEKTEDQAEKLQKQSLLYPLVSLYPIQLDFYLMVILKYLPLNENSTNQFNRLVEKRPPWPIKEKHADEKLNLRDLIDFIEECIKNRDLPTQVRASDIMKHSLEWLKELYKDANDELNYLREILKSGLSRLILVRDEGQKHETHEATMENREQLPYIDLRIASFCDYILEEIEELCMHLNEPFFKIQKRVDAAQAYKKDGYEILERLDEKREKLFYPFFKNIDAFLESFDRILHRFASDDLEIPGEAVFLPALPMEKSSSQTWYSAFSDFKENKLVSNDINAHPEKLFQFPYWAYAVLGPRIVGKLYTSAINQAFEDFNYPKARTYFKTLKMTFIKSLAFLKKVKLTLKLISSRKQDELREFTGLKIKNSILAACYRSQFRMPFILKIIFGIGILVMAEMDYELWTREIIYSTPFTALFVVIFFILGGFLGSYSLIPGNNRIQRAVGLFIRLFVSALIPALICCLLVFPGMFGLFDLSFLFLIFGSIFFAVVVNTIGNINKK